MAVRRIGQGHGQGELNIHLKAKITLNKRGPPQIIFCKHKMMIFLLLRGLADYPGEQCQGICKPNPSQEVLHDWTVINFKRGSSVAQCPDQRCGAVLWCINIIGPMGRTSLGCLTCFKTPKKCFWFVHYRTFGWCSNTIEKSSQPKMEGLLFLLRLLWGVPIQFTNR